jgi:hypothetical protein
MVILVRPRMTWRVASALAESVSHTFGVFYEHEKEPIPPLSSAFEAEKKS